MGMSQDIERYRAAGLAAEYHRWERDTFVKTVKTVLKALDADPAAEPRARFGLNEKGVITLWLYAADPTAARGGGDPPGGDESFPCPPLCGP